MGIQKRITILLDWCSHHGIVIDPRLSLRPDTHGGIGVFTMEDGDAIPPHTTVVSIPKESILSTRSCAASEHITPAYAGREASLALSSALYTELPLGTESKWWGYLQSLPGKFDLPICWDAWVNGKAMPLEVSEEDFEDMGKALEWLRGTEAEKILHGSAQKSGVGFADLLRYFEEVLEPLSTAISPQAREWQRDVELNRFMRAYCLVSSRAFLVDAYQGLAMVPIADAVNHVQENHVHMQSDYHVCPECGALRECPHDRTEEDSTQRNPPDAKPTSHSNDGSYEMVSNAPIPPSIEVFNTYGESLSNAELLCQYGFALEANDNDVLTWTEDELFDLAPSGIPATVRRELTRQLNELDFQEEDTQFLVGSSGEGGRRYLINADGQVSIRLWTLLSLVSLLHATGEGDDGCMALMPSGEVGSGLHSLYELQVALENQLELEEGVDSTGDVNGLGCVDSGYLAMSKRTCETIVALCQRRKTNTGRLRGLDDDDALADGKDEELLDEGLGKSRTRNAMLLAMSEKAILSSCEATWSELLIVLERAIAQ